MANMFKYRKVQSIIYPIGHQSFFFTEEIFSTCYKTGIIINYE